MTKLKKTMLISLFSILLTIFLIFILYYVYFYPKIITTPINNSLETKKIDVLKKFSIDDFSLSLKNKSVSSTIILNDTDLTDLVILCLKENSSLEKYISGIKINIEDNYINLYCNLNYKGIPFCTKFDFTINNNTNAIILHYTQGKFGFIPIPKQIIFSKLKDTPILKFDKDKGDILLTLPNIKQLTISNANINNNKIYITINGSLKFK